MALWAMKQMGSTNPAHVSQFITQHIVAVFGRRRMLYVIMLCVIIL